jgi:tRNA G18 (ribose-2'-O)-methylase SpoU
VHITHIDNVDHKLLDPFRDVRTTNLTRWNNWMIAEGALVVERLIQSSFQTGSILVSESKLSRVMQFVTPDIQILVVPDSIVNKLVGFEFHNGIMACGIRSRIRDFDCIVDHSKGNQLIVVCPFIALPDNLGSIIRIAAAMGASAVAIGNRSADPFSRRTIRVSMGNAFKIPIIEPDDLFTAIVQLKKLNGYEIIGTVLDKNSLALGGFVPSSKTVLLLGNESLGLEEQWKSVCDRKVTIPMQRDVDSLNVADSLAIFLWELVLRDQLS